MSVKLAYNPKTKKIVNCGTQPHCLSIKTKFDSWVRAIYFPEVKRLYFRFYLPSGDYYFVQQEDHAKSFDVCSDALDEFLKQKVIPKKTKILWWDTDKKVSTFDIQ